MNVAVASVERHSRVTHEKDAGVDFIAGEGAVGISFRQVVGSPVEKCPTNSRLNDVDGQGGRSVTLLELSSLN
jgi:hypothetical protein